MNDEYRDYLKHQASKLPRHLFQITLQDKQYCDTVYARYFGLDLEAKTVLCLGARLGGEVRAFKKLNAVAIGIDINPGDNNPDVLYGDFHDVPFSSGVFDVVFCNCIDHVFDLDKFLYECKRLLKFGGLLILEIAIQKAGEYETIDTQDISGILDKIKTIFGEYSTKKIDNGWQGISLQTFKLDAR